MSGFFVFRPASLIAARESKGWSREALAERADSSYPAILSYENGYRTPTIPVLLRLADALGVKPIDLVEESPFEAAVR